MSQSDASLVLSQPRLRNGRLQTERAGCYCWRLLVQRGVKSTIPQLRTSLAARSERRRGDEPRVTTPLGAHSVTPHLLAPPAFTKQVPPPCCSIDLHNSPLSVDWLIFPGASSCCALRTTPGPRRVPGFLRREASTLPCALQQAAWPIANNTRAEPEGFAIGQPPRPLLLLRSPANTVATDPATETATVGIVHSQRHLLTSKAKRSTATCTACRPQSARRSHCRCGGHEIFYLISMKLRGAPPRSPTKTPIRERFHVKMRDVRAWE